MSKTFETTVQINGAIGGSFNSSFRTASSGLKNLSSRAKAAQQEMNRLGSDYRKGTIHQSQYAEGTAKLSRELKQLEGSQRRITALKSTFSSGMNTAKTVASVGAVGATATAAGIAMSSLNTAGNFQQQMSKVSAVSGATGADLTRLNDTAQNLGKSTVFSATQAAEGMEYLALAGWKTDAIISAMPGMLNLAAAGSLDLGRAADITSDTMQAFGMGAAKAGHAADVFAYAQANANTNVEMIGEAMKYAAPTANQFKWSLEETSAAMMALANQGLKGSIAGQAFSSSMGKLAEDEGKAAKKAKSLGMEFFDAHGKMKSLPGVIKEIEKGTAGMSDKQRVNTLQTIFGAEAFKHWAILLSTGSDELDRMTTAMEKSDGTAAKMSATMVDNYAGSIKLLKSSIEGAQIKFMTPVLPVLQKFFGGITGTLDKNMGGIEKAGKATAKVLSDITAPFSTSKPIKPKITPDMDPADAKKMMIQYSKDLQKYEMFNDMGFGEKVEYMLDTTMQKAESWLGGPGGEAMGRIFTKLGTIAGKAWIAGLTGAASGALSSAMEGNFSGALGLGAAAWMLGGGTLMKGAIGAGRWAMEKRGGKETKKDSSKGKKSEDIVSTSTESKNKKKKKGKDTAGSKKNNKEATTTSKNSAAKEITSNGGKGGKKSVLSSIWDTGKGLAKGGGKALSTAGKWAGKGLVPLSLISGGLDIFKSSDKVKATGEAAGGTVGGWGGAKAGAAIGTMFGPIGTVAGGAIGGAAGYFGGKWLGGKAVDTVRSGGEPAKPEPAQASAPTKQANTEATKPLDTTKLNESANKLATTLETTNTAFTPIATSAPIIGQTMTTLATSLVTTNTAFTAISTSAPMVGQTMTTLTGSFTELQTSASTTAANMNNLTMYTGSVSMDFVTSFYSLKTATDQSTSNMSSLAAAIASATGMFNMQGIQTATQAVIASLNSFKTRIDNAQVPTGGGTTSRRTALE
ncbi:phage tail tape measure protein [Lysinibacillus sp. NPDC093692]|uniref:phage tail tape measure protein n=1 Tax=Lysinibacillus sp. NPDC093692 TaxID=3390578 RepID=UPI003D039389